MSTVISGRTRFRHIAPGATTGLAVDISAELSEGAVDQFGVRFSADSLLLEFSPMVIPAGDARHILRAVELVSPALLDVFRAPKALLRIASFEVPSEADYQMEVGALAVFKWGEEHAGLNVTSSLVEYDRNRRRYHIEYGPRIPGFQVCVR